MSGEYVAAVSGVNDAGQGESASTAKEVRIDDYIPAAMYAGAGMSQLIYWMHL